MELTEIETLRLIQERICVKVSSFSDWASFIDWANSITATTFKAFISVCFDDAIAQGDLRKNDLQEMKALFEGG